MHGRRWKQLWRKYRMKDTALIVFQKKPEKGQVKTRLAQTIGDEKAVEVYRYLLDHTHRQLALLQIPVFVYFDNAIDRDFLLQENYSVAVQKGKDLGEKMKTALKEVFSASHQKVFLLGSDCPGLETCIIQEAIESLKSNDLVIGPAKDGGYYLIGMKKPHDALFENKSWSTSTVLADTLREAQILGLTVSLLKELSDVDVYEDLSDGLKQRFNIR